jgi:hypothetical protein
LNNILENNYGCGFADTEATQLLDSVQSEKTLEVQTFSWVLSSWKNHSVLSGNWFLYSLQCI